MNIKKLTVRKGYTFFRKSPRSGMYDLKSGVGAGKQISVDIDSEEFLGQRIKFVEVLNGTLDVVIDASKVSKDTSSKSVSVTKNKKNSKGKKDAVIDEVSYPTSLDGVDFDKYTDEELALWSVTLGSPIVEGASRASLIATIEESLEG